MDRFVLRDLLVASAGEVNVLTFAFVRTQRTATEHPKSTTALCYIGGTRQHYFFGSSVSMTHKSTWLR